MSINIQHIIQQESIEILMQLVISPNRDFTAGIEALSRGIDHTTGLIIAPLTLLDMAQQADMQQALDELLFRKSLEAFKPIHENHPELLLFINLSDAFIAQALTDSFICNNVEAVGVSSGSIVFDINPQTEDAMVHALNFIEQYRKLGFYICIDDIGVGYHNLDKVIYLNPDMIKVNIAQGRKLENIQYRSSLTRFMKLIADQLGILLVAKGIEDEEDVQLTLQNGAQFMQGFYISKPVNLAQHSLDEIIARYREAMNHRGQDSGVDLELTRSITARVISITRDIRHTIGSGDPGQMRSDSEAFFDLYPFIENIWFLDRNGRQLDKTFINIKKHTVKSSPMFQVYNEGSDFSSKEIYRQLTDTILDVWVTRPYRSVLTNNVVIGCSMYAQEGVEDTILCVNFNYQGIADLIR